MITSSKEDSLKDLAAHISARKDFYVKVSYQWVLSIAYTLSTLAVVTCLILAASGSLFFIIPMLLAPVIIGLGIYTAEKTQAVGLNAYDLATFKDELIDLAQETPEITSILSPAFSDIEKNKLNCSWYQKLLAAIKKTPPVQVEISKPSFESVFGAVPSTPDGLLVVRENARTKDELTASPRKNIWRV